MIFFACLYYLSLFSALRPCSLSLLPVLSPCPHSLSPFYALVAVRPRLSACLFQFLVWFTFFAIYAGGSFKGTWLGLMSPLRCLAQTVLGVLPRHCTGAFPRQYFGVVSKYYCGALAEHYIGVLHMHIDIDIDF